MSTIPYAYFARIDRDAKLIVDKVRILKVTEKRVTLDRFCEGSGYRTHLLPMDVAMSSEAAIAKLQAKLRDRIGRVGANLLDLKAELHAASGSSFTLNELT